MKVYGWREGRSEYFGICEVEGEDAGIGATVEGGAEALESLLAGGIPDLRRDGCEHGNTWRLIWVSSMEMSWEKKSAPMVALYLSENFWWMYWRIMEVLPTLGENELLGKVHTWYHRGR